MEFHYDLGCAEIVSEYSNIFWIYLLIEHGASDTLMWMFAISGVIDFFIFFLIVVWLDF